MNYPCLIFDVKMKNVQKIILYPNQDIKFKLYVGLQVIIQSKEKYIKLWT